MRSSRRISSRTRIASTGSNNTQRMSTRKEFGDWQTPIGLAKRVAALVKELYGQPRCVVEPTCGIGTFLIASREEWGGQVKYQGYEVNSNYVDEAREKLGSDGVEILQCDFFGEDWSANIGGLNMDRVLIIGNPPWITNSELGQLGSSNLPAKTNFQGLRGFEARTGKSNFDIAEWMLIRLIEALPEGGAMAMLCKTMTARKVLKHLWKTDNAKEGAYLFHIDAQADFGVAVDACLFFITGKRASTRIATMFSDLDITSSSKRFGYVGGDLVSDMDAYEQSRVLDGGCSSYVWRSGVKHDAAKVMEFTLDGSTLINGLGERVDIEDDYVFPLLKSSDLGNGRGEIRKAVLVTQRRTGDDTSEIAHAAPKTWAYLLKHASALDERGSSIYEDRPRFSVFGIGSYSFAPWKVAISGLYKQTSFMLVPPVAGRPVMVDDTCYSIPCKTQAEAEFLVELLNSGPAQEFLNSLIFFDAKRPITIDVLRRLSFVELARKLDRIEALRNFVEPVSVGESGAVQMSLLMEPEPVSNAKRPRRTTTAQA